MVFGTELYIWNIICIVSFNLSPICYMGHSPLCPQIIHLQGFLMFNLEKSMYPHFIKCRFLKHHKLLLFIFWKVPILFWSHFISVIKHTAKGSPSMFDNHTLCMQCWRCIQYAQSHIFSLGVNYVLPLTYCFLCLLWSSLSVLLPGRGHGTAAEEDESSGDTGNGEPLRLHPGLPAQ